jgi:tetratricopeptide (TPR) repeat protein
VGPPAPASVDELDVLTRLRERMLGRSDAGRVVGRYRLVRPLGQGGMGEVWQAEDPRLDRDVALKLLHRGGRHDVSHGRARLLREAQAIAQITHPNVVAVFDCGTVTTDGVPQAFIAMELVDGQPLDAWMASEPRTPAQILAVFVDAGRGLAAAHAVGQIHRDFKPANVMVTTDGRAKVLDFGLVLHESESQVSHSGVVAPARQGESTDVDSLRLTAPGLVMGTPRYMAPEQHSGGTVTAASDQFAFCCALLEALQGNAVFAGDTYADVGRAKIEGRVHRKGARPVPSWLRSILERGLDPAPASRWPSMAVLLRRLERPRGRMGTKVFVGVAGLGLAGFIVMPDRDRCDASSWSSDRAEQLMTRLVEPDDDPRTKEVAQRVVERVDDYGTRVAAHGRTSCEAHRDASIDDTAFERRVSCLAERSHELAATVSVLENTDVVAQGRADAILGTLRDPDACIDDSRPDAAIDRPDDDGVAQLVDEVRRRLSRARALRIAGKSSDARAELDAARTDLGDTDHPPVSAELELETGMLAAELGESTDVESLERALMVAESCRHDRVAAEAASALIHALTENPDAYDRVLALVQRGDALVRRVGDPPALRGRYWMAVGGLRMERMEYEESLAAYERSYASLSSVRPPEDPEVGVARANLGTVLRALERHDEAIAHHREVFAVRERTLGPHHPRTIRLLSGLAQDHEVADRPEEAIVLYQDAITRAETGLGPNHQELANALGGFARVARKLGRYDDSRAAYLRALEIAERRGESESADAALLLSNLGNLERQTDRLDEARKHVERALELRERQLGGQHYWTGQSQYTLAGIELLAGNYERARVLALDAASTLATARGAQKNELSHAQIRVVNAYLELGRLDDARRHLALAIAAAPEEDVGVLTASGRIQLADGDPTGAIASFTKATELAKDAWLRGEARTRLAVAQRVAGDPSAAAASFARARDELESAREAGRAGLRLWHAAQRGD